MCSETLSCVGDCSSSCVVVYSSSSSSSSSSRRVFYVRVSPVLPEGHPRSGFKDVDALSQVFKDTDLSRFDYKTTRDMKGLDKQWLSSEYCVSFMRACSKLSDSWNINDSTIQQAVMNCLEDKVTQPFYEAYFLPAPTATTTNTGELLLPVT
jgi:hypothetical protein